MNDIPTSKPDTVSVYLQGPRPVDRVSLPVSQVTVLEEQAGALIWVDPVGHVQLSEEVLVQLVNEYAKRVLVDAGLAERTGS